MHVLALGFDLFFKPKMMEAARAAGVELVFAAPADAAAKAAGASRVVADASAPGVLDALRAVRAARPDVPVLACYPHVEERLAREAEALGARTMTRGAFAQALPDALAGKL